MEEKCAFSSTCENSPVHVASFNFCRRSVGFDHGAGMSVPCSDQVDPHGSPTSERRPVTHCEAVPEIVGSDGSCIQRDTFWPAVHETLAVVAQDQRVFPEGEPIPHDQGHMWRNLGSCYKAQCWGLLVVAYANDGCLPHGLGSGS